MQAPLPIELSSSRRSVAALVGGIAFLNVLVLIGTAVARALRSQFGWKADLLLRQLDLSQENVFAAWYSSLLLLVAALLLFGCFVLDREQSRTRGARVLSYGWMLLALLFAGLSWDESGSLHERLGSVAAVRSLPGMSAFGGALHGWVALLALPIVVVGVLLLAFSFLRLRRNPVALTLFALGILLFLSVPLQEELEVRSWALGGRENRSVLWLLLEEGTEIFASLCLIASATLYSRMLVEQREMLPGRRAGHASFSLTRNGITKASAAFALGFAATGIGLPEVMNIEDGRGIPINWFPGVLSFFAAALSLYLAWRIRRGGAPAASALPFALLGVFCLVLSVDHGSNHLWTQRLAAEQPGRRMMLDTLWIAATWGIALAVALRPAVHGTRTWVAGWALLLSAAVLAFPDAAVVLAFAAHAVLLVTLVGPLGATLPQPGGERASPKGLFPDPAPKAKSARGAT